MKNELTELEQNVINAIVNLRKQQELIYIGDIENAGLATKKVRGALSSLVKKGMIDVNKEDGGLISLLI